MRQFTRFFLSLGLLSCFCSVSAALSDKEQMTALVDGNNQFSFDAYQQLKNQKGNLFFSPYSISSAFAMAAAGARGDTAKEMFYVLHFNPDAFPAVVRLNKQLINSGQSRQGSPVLQIANAIWPQKNLQLLAPFTAIIQKDFGSSIETLDYVHEPAKAVETINRWALDHTNGKIKDLLSLKDVSADTRLILTSAVYMKAAWLRQFNNHATSKAPFHIDANQSIEIDMMQSTDRFSLFVDDEAAVIELPYIHDTQGPALAMLVVLPKQIEGLAKLESGLSLKKLNSWKEQMSRQRVQLSFPKFKIENKMDLNDVMAALGMKLAFTRKADFSGITGSSDLFINEAIHQTFINVDENGTEAAAVTALGMRTTSIEIPEEPYEFIADHPFFFIIVDQRTQTILFMGRCVSF